MKLKKSISVCAVVLMMLISTTMGFSAPKTPVKMDSKWTGINGQNVDLSAELKSKNELYILYFCGTDCVACVDKGLEQIHRLDSNAYLMLGYALDSEINLYSQKYKNLLILKDFKKALFVKMHLRQLTPVILKVNKNLEIIEYIKVDLTNH